MRYIHESRCTAIFNVYRSEYQPYTFNEVRQILEYRLIDFYPNQLSPKSNKLIDLITLNWVILSNQFIRGYSIYISIIGNYPRFLDLQTNSYRFSNIMEPINKLVELELLIDGIREKLFKKFTNQNHPDIQIGQDQGTLTYNVKEVNPLKNSEVVFNVTVCSTSLKYYAFEYKVFLCFPAFLTGFFEINDPVCLVVGDDFKHYYVFQRINEIVSLSSIISNAEKLRGEHVFNPSTIGTNLLLLNSENKKMRCFPKVKNVNLIRKVNIEFSKFKAGLQKLINESKIMPDYSFVPREAKDKFKMIYGSLLNDNFDFGYYSMVHKSSESYGEFMKFIKT